jgi:hypothetical protein
VTFQYHGFGNSGGSSNAIANGMVPDKALVPQLDGPGFNVLTLGALEREQFAARALSLNAKQQHCRSAFGAVGSPDRIGMRRGWLIPGHRAHHFYWREYQALNHRALPKWRPTMGYFIT